MVVSAVNIATIKSLSNGTGQLLTENKGNNYQRKKNMRDRKLILLRNKNFITELISTLSE